MAISGVTLLTFMPINPCQFSFTDSEAYRCVRPSVGTTTTSVTSLCHSCQKPSSMVFQTAWRSRLRESFTSITFGFRRPSSGRLANICGIGLSTSRVSRSRVARWPRSWHRRKWHGVRDRGAGRGQPPSWWDLGRCRERIARLHFEGVLRDILGPTPNLDGHQPQKWKRGVSKTSRGAEAGPKFLLLGHQPQNWPPLDGMSMPSEKTSLTLLWNPHR